MIVDVDELNSLCRSYNGGSSGRIYGTPVQRAAEFECALENAEKAKQEAIEKLGVHNESVNKLRRYLRELMREVRNDPTK